MSGIRSITRRPTVAGYATAGSAPIYVDSDDNRLKLIPAGGGTTEVIIMESGGTSSVETLTAARVLTSVDSGKTFMLALVGGFTVTLPSLASAPGFRARFVVQVAPTTAYIIIANAADLDTMAGQVYGADGITSGAGSVTTFSADQLNFVASASVIGDQANFQAVGPGGAPGVAGWAGQAFVALGATGATFTG